MAQKFWVGGTGTWDSSTTTNWSTSSGGAGGAAVPGTADDVVFDINSNIAGSGASYTCTRTATTAISSITANNPSAGTLTFAGTTGININATGSPPGGATLTIGSSVSWTESGAITLSGTGTVTTNGNVNVSNTFNVNGSGKTITLGSDFRTSNSVTITMGTFDASTFNVTILKLLSSGSNTKAVKFGTQTWTLSATGTVVDLLTGATGLTTTPGAATITLTSASAKTFAGGGATYPTLNQGGTGALAISGSNTFANITNTVQPATVTLTAGTTQVFTSFSLSGTSGNVITLNSSSAGSAAIVSKSSGTVLANNLSIKDSTATGGAIWSAPISAGCVNVSGNTGWDFSTPASIAATDSSDTTSASGITALGGVAATDSGDTTGIAAITAFASIAAADSSDVVSVTASVASAPTAMGLDVVLFILGINADGVVSSGGGESLNVLQLGGIGLQLGGQDLTLGA